MEVRCELKVAVIGAGTQLVHMREAGNLEDKETSLSETSDPHLCSIQSQLRQIEADWSSLLTDVQVVQQALHKVRPP